MVSMYSYRCLAAVLLFSVIYLQPVYSYSPFPDKPPFYLNPAALPDKEEIPETLSGEIPSQESLIVCKLKFCIRLIFLDKEKEAKNQIKAVSKLLNENEMLSDSNLSIRNYGTWAMKTAVEKKNFDSLKPQLEQLIMSIETHTLTGIDSDTLLKYNGSEPLQKSALESVFKAKLNYFEKTHLGRKKRSYKVYNRLRELIRLADNLKHYKKAVILQEDFMSNSNPNLTSHVTDQVRLLRFMALSGDIIGAEQIYESIKDNADKSCSKYQRACMIARVSAAFSESNNLNLADKVLRESMSSKNDSLSDEQKKALNSLISAYKSLNNYDRAVKIVEFIVNNLSTKSSKSYYMRKLSLIQLDASVVDKNNKKDWIEKSEKSFQQSLSFFKKNSNDYNFWIRERIRQLKINGYLSKASFLEKSLN